MNDWLKQLAQQLGGPVASHGPAPQEPVRVGGGMFSLPPQGERAPLPQSIPGQPRRARVFDSLLQAAGGALGIEDPLAEGATPATGIGALVGMLGPAAMVGGLKRIANPIRAYHGSPYDFDKFKMSQIGTGEGGQMYGHGLYFADSPSVAQSYRPNTATGSPGHLYEVNIHARPEELLDWDTAAIPSGADRARKDLRIRPTQTGGDLYAALNNKGARIANNPNVGLEDSEGLGNLADRLGIDLAPAHPGSYADSDIARIAQQFENQASRLTPAERLTVRAMLNGPDVAASAALGDRGVPGLRYFDAHSRPSPVPHVIEMVGTDGRVRNTFRFATADDAKKNMPALKARQPDDTPRYVNTSGPQGSGTRNYVIWDEDVIEILRKYGILPPLAVGAAQGMKAAPSHDPLDKQPQKGPY